MVADASEFILHVHLIEVIAAVRAGRFGPDHRQRSLPWLAKDERFFLRTLLGSIAPAPSAGKWMCSRALRPILPTITWPFQTKRPGVRIIFGSPPTYFYLSEFVPILFSSVIGDRGALGKLLAMECWAIWKWILFMLFSPDASRITPMKSGLLH